MLEQLGTKSIIATPFIYIVVSRAHKRTAPTPINDHYLLLVTELLLQMLELFIKL